MATSGTTAFTMEFTEVAEEAWERAGREMRSGYDLVTARRSMNLLLIEWQNRGINLWTIEEANLDLVSGTAQYTLAADTMDVLEAAIRTGTGTGQQDIVINRISPSVFATIPNKNVTGRPVQFWIERLTGEVRINVWPVPDNSDYDFHYWKLRRIEDAGNGVETPDMPFRFFPALVAGLAVYIARKVPELKQNLPELLEDYERQFGYAENEDRTKVSSNFTPRIYRI